MGSRFLFPSHFQTLFKICDMRKEKPLRLNIAYAIDYRGPDDDQLTFVFIGVDSITVGKVFQWLIAGGYVAKGFMLTDEHACVYRNGKHYWRVSAQMDQPNMEFVSVDDMCLLIESRFKAMQHYITRISNYNKFLNT